MSFVYSYASFTDNGGREVNEDSIGVFKNCDNNCYILCDGLGGHGMGDVASSLIVDVFGKQFQRTDDVVNFLGDIFPYAQKQLMKEQIARNAKRKMKTTGVAIVTDDRNAYIGHIGDSRAYVFNRNKVKERTLDHSIPQMLVLSKEIKESEIRNHPERNSLLRVLGTEWEDNMYELAAPIPLKKTQAFLLCSDGFWELITEKEMCSQLKKAKDVQEWLDKMVEIVKENGIGREMDNFSAIAVWVDNIK
ncbi:MAG: serine/threonine-protein phosphatase [Clostridia bacterium]|nr:serine/threonine-protein phosphatase [Clostridia bacterium]MBQ9849060.1 serine/threonine-protein phosphatase [Clostridia bacterium]